MITQKLLRDWGACWSDNEINAHLAGRTGVSPHVAAADDTIDLEDRLWLICRALWHRSKSATRTFAIDSAALVSHLAGNDRDQAEHARLIADLRRIYALPVGRRDSQLRSWEAARGAAWTAAVAGSAAWGTAWSAAWGTAGGTAGATAWSAAGGAGWGTELRKTIDRALVALERNGWTS